jgi:primosomal protein N''
MTQRERQRAKADLNKSSIAAIPRTAQGYFDHGLFTEAWEILDVLSVDVRESNEAMELRLKILAATERWEQCQFLAEGLVQRFPSWRLPRLHGAEAKAILELEERLGP